jgi:hypothetical protein
MSGLPFVSRLMSSSVLEISPPCAEPTPRMKTFRNYTYPTNAEFSVVIFDEMVPARKAGMSLARVVYFHGMLCRSYVGGAITVSRAAHSPVEISDELPTDQSLDPSTGSRCMTLALVLGQWHVAFPIFPEMIEHPSGYSNNNVFFFSLAIYSPVSAKQ